VIAPRGYVEPLRAVSMSGKPLAEVMLHAVEIDGPRYVDEAWARREGEWATTRARSVIQFSPSIADALSLVARQEPPQQRVHLEPSRVVYIDGEAYTQVDE
jgi:hypothetical protein